MAPNSPVQGHVQRRNSHHGAEDCSNLIHHEPILKHTAQRLPRKMFPRKKLAPISRGILVDCTCLPLAAGPLPNFCAEWIEQQDENPSLLKKPRAQEPSHPANPSRNFPHGLWMTRLRHRLSTGIPRPGKSNFLIGRVDHENTDEMKERST